MKPHEINQISIDLTQLIYDTLGEFIPYEIKPNLEELICDFFLNEEAFGER